MKVQMTMLISILAFSLFANAEAYKLDTQKSNIQWLGSKVIGKDAHNGNLSFKEGSVDVSAGKLTAGNFVVDMNSMTNEDLKDNPTYQAKLLGHLKNEDFFNVPKYPEATLKITSVEQKSANEATITGDLTIAGKTNPVSFPAQIKLDKNTVSGDAKLKIDRTKWDIKYRSGKFFANLGDKIIKDEIELSIKIVATK